MVEDNKCHMVEIKEIEIKKSVVTSYEQMEHSIIKPESVELVEITDSGPEESEPEDRHSPSTVRRTPDQRNRKTLAPSEILAKRQKLSSDEITRLNNGSREQNAISSPVAPMEVEEAKETTVEVKKETDIPPLCLQISDHMDHTEQTTVTAWNETHEKVLKPEEVTLRKEVQVSKTYQIFGNFSKDNATRPPRDEDCDSFYGSDKETDDAVVFSEDEARIEDDSSDDELEPIGHDEEQSKVCIHFTYATVH
jgi:hypothetical protein